MLTGLLVAELMNDTAFLYVSLYRYASGFWFDNSILTITLILSFHSKRDKMELISNWLIVSMSCSFKFARKQGSFG